MFSLHKVSIEFKYKWEKKIEMEKARENVQTVFNIIFIVWDFHCVLLGAAVCFFLYLHSLQSFSPLSVLSCSAAEVFFKKVANLVPFYSTYKKQENRASVEQSPLSFSRKTAKVFDKNLHS